MNANLFTFIPHPSPKCRKEAPSSKTSVRSEHDVLRRGGIATNEQNARVRHPYL